MYFFILGPQGVHCMHTQKEREKTTDNTLVSLITSIPLVSLSIYGKNCHWSAATTTTRWRLQLKRPWCNKDVRHYIKTRSTRNRIHNAGQVITSTKQREMINDWDNSSNGMTGEQAPPDLGTGQDTSATLCYYTPIPSHQEKTELSWLVHPKDSETQHRVKALSRWDHQVQHGNLDWILKRSKETLCQSSKPAYRLITDFQISRFVIGMPKEAGW